MVAGQAKELVGILMESSLYFELTPEERLSLLKHILRTSPAGDVLDQVSRPS